jgi:type IV pilus assembly protein PilN
MNSFLATEEKKDKAVSSLLPRVEDSYGSFVVTVDLGEMGVTATDDTANASVSTDKEVAK